MNTFIHIIMRPLSEFLLVCKRNRLFKMIRLLKHHNIFRELQVQFLCSTYLLSQTLTSESLFVNAKKNDQIH